MRRHYADPANYERIAARARALSAAMTPEERQRRSVAGKAKAHALIAAAARMPVETRLENGRKRSATVLAWCPPEWRDRYREFKQHGRSAAEAKALVLHLIAGKPMPQKYAQQRQKMAWCPDDRRAEYEQLRHKLGAPEARRRLEASFSPFERQMSRLRQGARLVSKPVMRVAEHAYSLTGGSMQGL